MYGGKYVPVEDRHLDRLAKILGDPVENIVKAEVWCGERRDSNAYAKVWYKGTSQPTVIPFDSTHYNHVIGGLACLG